MKKSLLSLAMLLCGMGTWAQSATTLPEVSTAENPIYYTMQNTRSTSGRLIYFDGSTIKDNNPAVLDDKYQFYFTDAGNGKVKICNKATNLKLAAPGSWTEAGADCTIGVTPHSSNAGLYIQYGTGNNEYLNEQNFGPGYTNWSANDEGSIFVIEKVEDVHMPVAGKTYIIEAPLFVHTQGVMKGMTVVTDATAPTWNTVKYTNENDQWEFNTNNEGKISLKNVAANKWLKGTPSSSQSATLSDTEVWGDITYLGSGQFNITTNNATLHAAGHGGGAGASGTIVTWGGGINTASARKFVESEESEFALAFYDYAPVNITSDDNNKKYFAIHSGRGTNYWYTYTNAGKIHLNAYTGADTQLWYFKACMDDAGENALIRLFPKNGNGQAMSYQNTTDGPAKIQAQAVGTDGWTNTWKLIYVDGLCHYRMQTADGITYLSNWGGAGNDMGMWAGNVTTDVGTQMYIYDSDAALQELNNLIATAKEATSRDDVYGYKKYSEALATAINDAYTQNSLNTVPEIFTCWKNLNTTINGLETILPTPGFYRIKNYEGNACLVSGTSGQAKFRNGDAEKISSVFYYDGTNLVSFENGTYFGNNSGAFLHYNNAVSNGYSIQFESYPSMEGKCFVKFPGGAGNTTNCDRYLYSASVETEGSETNANGGSNVTTALTDMHWRFNVEPVQWLPIPMTAEVGYATIYSPVELGLADRVEAYTAMANYKTAVAEMTSQSAVPANTGVLLKYKEGAELSNGCVYLPIQATTLTDVESDLKGTLADANITPDADQTCYVLSKPADSSVAFYRARLNDNTFLNNGFKAYLPVTAPTTGMAAARFVFDFGGTETGIENINGTEAEANGNAAIYDLSGRRVNAAQKGIYIINGKKVIK